MADNKNFTVSQSDNLWSTNHVKTLQVKTLKTSGGQINYLLFN